MIPNKRESLANGISLKELRKSLDGYKPLGDILDRRRASEEDKEIDSLWDDYVKLNNDIGRDDYVIDDCDSQFDGAIQILKLMFNVNDKEVEDEC